ncbi:MAG: flagellar motor protein MotB [Myxococcaceae bacterium]|jgi:chemotaxis protein MotB|nr:flagellar motor protein MotB [Myxococcaceae bacterium]MCA3014803.1 flagellar motor protein MotB [Myxococcaceae bacterium]
MAKKHKHEEHENHERWVISYADLVTLLFALFVVLYASSKVDNNKLAETTESMRWALNWKGEGGIQKLSIFKGPPTEGGCVTNTGAQPVNTPVDRRVLELQRKKLERALKSFLMERTRNPTIAFEIEQGKLRLRLAAQRFFDPASASLRPESIAVLDAIAAEIAGSKMNIGVEGHTDDEPVRTARFRSNWELSASRAATVVSYLEQAHAIPATRLSAAGLASQRPLVPNDSAENREANRRIEFVLELPRGDPLAGPGP